MAEEALLFGEREAQILAAREIENLDSKQKQRLSSQKGVIPQLVFMLHSQDYESIEASLFALLNLAFGSERNKLRMAKSGVIPALIKILQCENEALVELALGALLILSSCSANKPEIASSGVIQLLFKLLDSSFSVCQSVSHQAKLDIISTIHNLSTSPKIVPSIVLSGGLISLFQLIYMSDTSSDLVEKAMAVLESVVSASDVALNQACETGGVIQMLVEAVEEGSDLCKEHAVGILLMICRSCRERYRGMILREGAMPGLLQLSVDGAWRAREKSRALLLLLRDCSNDRGSPSSRVVKNSKSLEKVMRQIDREERAGTSIQMVEEMIAKLRT